MGKIDTSGWKEFHMVDIGFKVYHGSRITKAERVEGDTVFLTAGFENCGVVGTIGNENIDVWEKPITVDMFGNVFYHDETCAGDDNIYAFLNSELSRTAKLFVASSVASVTQSKYSYQQQFRQGDANKLSVYLPATPDGAPDWTYMESYMANLETRVADSLTLLHAAKDAEKKKVDTKEWGEFRVGELFEVKISKSVDKGGLEFAEDGEYDFTIYQDDKLIAVIEFNGIQHYKPRSVFGGEKAFQMQKKHDLMKVQYCVDHGLYLLQIPYKTCECDTEEYVRRLFRNLDTYQKIMENQTCWQRSGILHQEIG